MVKCGGYACIIQLMMCNKSHRNFEAYNTTTYLAQDYGGQSSRLGLAGEVLWSSKAVGWLIYVSVMGQLDTWTSSDEWLVYNDVSDTARVDLQSARAMMSTEPCVSPSSRPAGQDSKKASRSMQDLLRPRLGIISQSLVPHPFGHNKSHCPVQV